MIEKIEKVEKIIEALKPVAVWTHDLYIEDKELYQKWKQERKSFKLVKETKYYKIYTSENGLWVELNSEIGLTTLLYFVSL